MARLPNDSIDLAAEIAGAANALLSIAEEVRAEQSVKAAAIKARIKTSIVFLDLQRVIEPSLRPTVVPAFEAGQRRTLSDVLGTDVVAMAVAAGDEEHA